MINDEWGNQANAKGWPVAKANAIKAGGEDTPPKTLREVLNAAEQEFKTTAMQVAVAEPQATDYAKGTEPIQATNAHKNITQYGEAYALFLERSGDEVFIAAQEYKEYCYKMAERARDEYKAEAARASDYINNIQKRAKALDFVAKGMKEE